MSEKSKLRRRTAFAAQVRPRLKEAATVTPVKREAYEAQRAALVERMNVVSAAEFGALPLELTEGTKTGVSPKDFYKGGEHTFLVKPRPANSTQYELDFLANSLRHAAGEPVVALFERKIERPDGTLQDSYAKPMLPVKGDLPERPQDWTPEQTRTVLADLPWFEFLGNFDSKRMQYVVLEDRDGNDATVNVDWDLTLKDYVTPRGPLDRHKTHATLGSPPASSRLLMAYVHGELDLDFTPLFDAVERIEKLDEATLRAAASPLCEKAFADGKTLGHMKDADGLHRAMRSRQLFLREDVTALVENLIRERLGRSGCPDVGQASELLKRDVKDVKLSALLNFEDSRWYSTWMGWQRTLSPKVKGEK